MSNKQKEAFSKRKQETEDVKNKEGKGPAPLLDMKLYQQPVKKSHPPPVPPMIPINNPFFPYPNPYYPYTQMPMQPYIMKNYNISMSNPSGSHAKMSALYEDILPGKNFYQTANTLGERFEMYRYIRNVLIKTSDGEDISLDAASKNSLLHRIKLMDVNPYTNSPFYSNPYKDLPYGFLLYNSCYPIRYDNTNGKISCSKNSVGINVRIYRLSIAEYNVHRLKNKYFVDFDVWREIAYYEYIREEILKPKMCPNFSLLYSWYMDENCEVDFDKLGTMTKDNRRKKFAKPDRPMDLLDVLNATNKIDSMGKKETTILELPSQAGGSGSNGSYKKYTGIELANAYSQIPKRIDVTDKPRVNAIEDDKIEIDIDLDEYSKKAVIALTEAPNSNLYDWASKTYETDGIRKVMISTGFYNDEIWMSVLFQIMAALYAMQIKGIVIRNFSLEDNVYVKDLFTTGSMTGYWIYKIDDIEYYIPNYGYLVLIDSKFKDLEDDETLLIRNKKRPKFKIESRIYTDDTKNKNYSSMAFRTFAECFDSDKFGPKEKNKGFVPPSDNVKEILENISKDIKEKSSAIDDYKNMVNDKVDKKTVGYYIHKHMRKFLNNRVGTWIQTDEKDNVRPERDNSFKKGEMVLYETDGDTMRWCIYIGKDKKLENTALVYTKDKPSSDDVRVKSISNALLRKYSDYKMVKQDYKADASKLSSDNKLESYIMAL